VRWQEVDSRAIQYISEFENRRKPGSADLLAGVQSRLNGHGKKILSLCLTGTKIQQQHLCALTIASKAQTECVRSLSKEAL
jgi:hypothetical protein